MPLNINQIITIRNYKINHLYNYQPYWIYGQKNPNFDAKSGLLLDLKERKPESIIHFEKCVIPNLSKDDVVCIVPSHDPTKTECGTKDVALKKITNGVWNDGTDCLKRHKKIKKLASGGDRSIQTHMDSIVVNNIDKIKDKNVFLLDDITTTGHSLQACKYLLLQAGATSVECFAFGKTV